MTETKTAQEILTELEHYGVKGMKWGVRRDRRTLAKARAKSGSAAKSQKVLTAEAKVKKDLAAKLKQGGVDSMTNEEIKTYTERLRLENQLNQVRNERNAKIHKNIKTVLDYGGDAMTAYKLYHTVSGKSNKKG